MWIKFAFLLLCAASLTQINAKSREDDDERWSWGLVEEPVTIRDRSREQSSTSSTIESSNFDPNADYNLPKPSFKAPGRRISEEKCEEFLNDVKLMEETSKGNDDYEGVVRIPGHKQVIGGRNAEPQEFPHMGALGWKDVRGGYMFKCASTLISSKFVLTAAHCISATLETVKDPEPKIVRLNDGNLLENFDEEYDYLNFYISRDVNISRIIPHPQYKSPKKYNDIALMELQTEVKFTYKMRPACLWNRPDTGDFGTQVTLTGWGVLAPGSQAISPNLQAANVDIVDSEQCDDMLKNSRNRHWHGLADTQLCAGRLKGGVDACQGDSGGPLVFRKPLHESSQGNIYYVIGVTSFGIGCALPYYPGIYTRVSSYIDWIEENVWKN